jgi:hypothetical protein
MPRAVLPPLDHERVAGVIDRVLRGLVMRGTLRRDEVEDVRSEVMLRVLQQVKTSGGGEEVRSADDYIARITLNAATDVLRDRRTDPLPDKELLYDAREPQDALAARQMLELLWNEITDLPLQQRRALLLHVHDENGGSAIHLLVFTGVATLDEIAAVLEYTRAEAEALWDRVPMPDLAIATLLGMQRPQVISLRRAARERLERARKRFLSPRLKRWNT